MQQQNQQLLLLMQQQQQALPLVAAVAPQQSIVDDGGTADVAFVVGFGGGVGRVVDGIEGETRRSATTTATQFAKKQGMNQFDVMQNSVKPREPILEKKFPPDWNALVLEWRLLNLQSFRSSKTTVWNPVTRQRYSKRLRAMQQLRKYAERVDIDDDLKAAEPLDTEMKNRKYTLTTHYDFLVRNDHTIMRRKRSKRGGDDLL